MVTILRSPKSINLSLSHSEVTELIIDSHCSDSETEHCDLDYSNNLKKIRISFASLLVARVCYTGVSEEI